MRRVMCIAAILWLIFFSFCHKASEEKKNAKRANKIVCVLFDLSQSTNTQQIREAYARDFCTVLSKMHGGDAVVAALITEKSISELDFCIQNSFPAFHPTTDNPMYLEAERQEHERKTKSLKDSLQKVADSTLKSYRQKIMRTEIMSALHVAERVCKSYPQQNKILLIMSDMIEDSDLYNFARENLTEARTSEIIRREIENHRLPDLKNVCVYVTGAMAKTDQFYKVRNFWISYMQECGGALVIENYGGPLVSFEE